MKLTLPDWTEPIRNALPPGKVFAVGGFVRDILTGYPPHDLDITGPLPPEALSELPGWKDAVVLIPRETSLGTIGLRWQYGGVVCEAEYTAFRAESYLPGGKHRPDAVEFGVSREHDALRRDFTVNALYADLADGTVFDPLGGLLDLEKRLLRTTRSPYTVFADDGLRLLRLFRTAAELEFSVESATLDGAKSWIKLLANISPDRLYAELSRLLLADTRFPDHHYDISPVFRGLSLLREAGGCGVLGFTRVPSTTSLMRCSSVSPSLPRRLAAWVSEEPPSALKAMLLRWRLPTDLVRRVVCLRTLDDWDREGALPEEALRLGMMKMGFSVAEDWVELRSIKDNRCRWREALTRLQKEQVPESAADLSISGDDLLRMGIPPGPDIGKIKQALWEWAVCHPGKVDRVALLEQALRLRSDYEL
ncbi:MAG: CCA tRNA nucleotidyltransferase [Christensenellales bacterium]|jgi:hypothetical protein